MTDVQQSIAISLPVPFQSSLTVPFQAPPTQSNSGSSDAYAQNQTHFQFSWPREISGLERVILSAKGDLQRMLSAYFGSPITVAPQSKTECPQPSFAASPSTPIVQGRRVHLVCASRVVCIATSTVTLLNPSAARLILDEKYAIGQTYRELAQNPDFELVSVELDRGMDGKDRVTRRYRLKAPEMECEIEELFPDRAMFSEEGWLYSSD